MQTSEELVRAIDSAVRAVPGVVHLYAAKPMPHAAKQLTASLIPAADVLLVPSGLSSVSLSGEIADVLVSVGVTGDTAEVARTVAAAVRDALETAGADVAASQVHVRVSRAVGV